MPSRFSVSHGDRSPERVAIPSAPQARLDHGSIKRNRLRRTCVGQPDNRLPANLATVVFEPIFDAAGFGAAGELPVLNRPGRIELRKEGMLPRMARERQPFGPRPRQDASADSQLAG